MSDDYRKIPEVELRVRASDVRAKRRAIRTPLEVVSTLREILDGWDQERLVVLHLDARHRVIGWHEAARGGGNVVHVAPREILRTALIAGAMAIVISHNHPSGDPTPSADDLDLTRRISAACETVGVPMLDHVVLGEAGEFYSFASAGALK